MKVSLLTGGKDIHYALGLVSGLASRKISIDFIGNDEMQFSELAQNNNVSYLNLRGDQRSKAGISQKAKRVLVYYYKLLKYAATADSKLFHILWLNKFTLFDRTLLNVYYKLLGKQLIFTAHDINYRKLVGQDSFFNHYSLKFMYAIVDHLVVHTEKMRDELVRNYGVERSKISIIPFGVNIVMPYTGLTCEQARIKLNVDADAKLLLFFGNIAPYKGLEFLLQAFAKILTTDGNYRLIIAGRIKHDCQNYWSELLKHIKATRIGDHIYQRIEYIPEDEVELYFKAADVLILPYRNIFQSGLIYTSYRFGLPVIASDVGSLRDDVVEGRTGYICQPENADSLAAKIEYYFRSDLYGNLSEHRENIIKHGSEQHSWQRTGEKTFDLYKKLTQRGGSEFCRSFQ